MNSQDTYPDKTITDDNQKIMIDTVHVHELFYATFKLGHKCDICSATHMKNGYRCNQCDFDYCINCFETKKVPASLPPLFTEKPQACDFYNRSILTKVDSDYYHQMLDMLFNLISRHDRVMWSMTLKNKDGSVHMILPVESYRSDDPKTIMKCKQCNLTIRINTSKHIDIQCDYIKPTDKPFYTVYPIELREKYWTERYAAVKKHVNQVAHQFFMDEITMTLNGTYCA